MDHSSGSTRFLIIKYLCFCSVLLLSACSGRTLPPVTTLPGTAQILNTAISVPPIPSLTAQSILTHISPPTGAPTLTEAPVPPDIPLPTSTSLAASPSPTVLPIPSETPDTTPEPMNITMFDEQSGWLEVGYQSGPGHLFHTQDGGKTWQDVSPEPKGPFFSRAYLNAQTAWELVSQTDIQTTDQPGTLYRTDDGGKSWGFITVPFSDQVYLTFLNVQQGRSEKVTVCGAGTCEARFYQTNDGGQTWSLMPMSNPDGPEQLPPATVHILSNDGFFLQNTTTIWFGGNGCCAYPYADLRVSRDNGGSWQQLKLPLPERNPNSGIADFIGLPVFFTAKDGIFAASYERIHPNTTDSYQDYDMVTYITHDGSLTWVANPAILKGNFTLFQVHFVSLKDAFVLCGQNLCATHDGYKTWQVVHSNLVFNPEDNRPLVSFDFINARIGWAIVGTPGHNQLYKTIDGGASWIAMPGLERK